jgi:hypothetical protein
MLNITDKPETVLNSVCLYEAHGDISCFIEAKITEKGDLLIQGQDLGQFPSEGQWNIEEYESWVAVPAKHKDQLLLILLEGLYKGNPAAVQEFRGFLKARGVPFEFKSWQ